MATFSEIRTTINPAAVPAGTDLVAVEKADGNPAVYTLDELAAYIAGVSLPTWQTDASHGAFLKISSALQPHTGGVVPFNVVVRDTGFYTSDGVLTIPTGVTKVQVVAQIESTVAAPTLMVIKNSSIAAPMAKVECIGNYSQIVSPEFDVVAGDIVQIHCSDVTTIINDTSYFSLRTTEKLA